MWFRLRPVELDFLASAPRRWSVEAHVRAPRRAVWEAFVDAPSWPRWFPGVSEVSYPGGSPPYGVGTRREAVVRGRRWRETILAWDEGVRWAYRVDAASVPLARAQIECTEFADDGDGTRLRWTLAAEPRLLLRVTAPFMTRTLGDLLERAVRNLERELDLARRPIADRRR
jgi:carbon monoxide dehydrogenase subunit G